MIKTVVFASAVCAIGTLTIAWSQTKRPLQPVHQLVETVSPPERLTSAQGPLPELKFNDMSFVFTETDVKLVSAPGTASGGGNEG